MEHLARMIRSDGARNLLWVQGHHRGGSLTGIPEWHLSGVGPLAYDEHRPPAPHTVASWTASFGFLAIKYGYPVVEGEWADYSRTSAGWACWSDAPVTVPRFLSHPWLLESASLTGPNHFGSDWSCTDGLNEGAGQQIMTWLNRSNRGAA
jgi:hypothetical protein